VFVGTCVLLFIWAGFWQLGRLQTRRASNALITSREDAPPQPIQQVVPVDASSDQIAEVTFRRVVLSGTYKASDEVLINNRTNNGSPGFWVATPLVLDDGTAVVVNRGWIPLPFGDGGSPDAYRPPSGPVTVVGLVLDTQRQEGLGVSDPPDGTLSHLSRVDVPRLQKQVSEHLAPVYVNLITQQPAQAQAGNGPFAVPPPVLDDGPHLNYAGQWFLFATMTCIVYPLLLRRTARHKEIDARQAEIDATEAAAAAADEVPSAGGDDALEKVP
jgi:cytochrome oxidase assembly protein ShyY1